MSCYGVSKISDFDVQVGVRVVTNAGFREQEGKAGFRDKIKRRFGPKNYGNELSGEVVKLHHGCRRYQNF